MTSVTIEDGKSSFSFSEASFEDCPIETLYLGRNYSTIYNKLPFKNNTTLTNLTIGNMVTYIGKEAFSGCTGLTSVTIEDGESSLSFSEISFKDCPIETLYMGREIKGSYFGGTTTLTDLTVGNKVENITDGTFSGCTGLTSLTIGNSVTTIGSSAFSGCSGLDEIKSLNPIPPKIDSSVFEGVDKETCKLMVPKGSLVYYWLDPVWKEFLNISDDLLCLDVIPDAMYGDAPIDLAAGLPSGVSLVFESTNNDVAKIVGSMLQIVGAGEAAVVASVPEGGTPMEIIGQIRQFIVDKADLTAAARSYTINAGDEMPEFAIDFSGFVYDETEADIDQLPTAICDISDTAEPGEYEITIEGGGDDNYNINRISGKLKINKKLNVEVETPVDGGEFTCYAIDRQIYIIAPANLTIEVYDIDGIRHYSAQSTGSEITYSPAQGGIYIVRCGRNTAKVVVK